MLIESAILENLGIAQGPTDSVAVRETLAKARELRGLGAAEVASLMAVKDRELLEELWHAARDVKQRIYGSRLVLFAPLYISNLCGNECTYCAFRARNAGLRRRVLSQEEIGQEARCLVEEGHKRVLLVMGESYPNNDFSYVLRAIETIYATRSQNGEIRRVNVNLAPLTVDQFRALHEAQIGTYQIFQETYHRPTYANVHLAGKKRDYDWRITAIDRAMEGGIDDVGIGVLFGLYDWRYEVLAMLRHVAHLEKKFGVGPHTISVPRLEPAHGSTLAETPPYNVSDDDFRKIVAILRLAVPYTGIIMSTRESAEMRRETFALGVSQISAGSRTDPGGYTEAGPSIDRSQFQLGDHRSLDEVVRDIAEIGYIPSFCTGCYRLGRTGQDFMDLAKPGDIRSHCDPNAVSTFMEYLIDYASPATKEVGYRLIEQILAKMEPRVQKTASIILTKVQGGRRDVFV